MKPKKLKLLTTFLLLLPLCVVLLGAGCEKDENDYASDSIIGKWEWIYSTGGLAGNTIYPDDGQSVTLEFTEDSILIQCENNETVFETQFYILGDTLKYFWGLELECKINISSDTLFSYYLNISDSYNPVYKRIN